MTEFEVVDWHSECLNIIQISNGMVKICRYEEEIIFTADEMKEIKTFLNEYRKDVK